MPSVTILAFTPILACLIGLASLGDNRLFAQMRVDFNPDNGRSDVRSPDSYSWEIPLSLATERTLDGVSLQLKAVGSGEAKIAFDWWKAGYDVGANFVSDGVTTEKAGDSIELTIKGLATGRHTMASWHNRLSAVERTPQSGVQAVYRVEVLKSHQTSGSEIEIGNRAKPILLAMVEPTSRVLHDHDAATSFVAFDVLQGEEVIVRYSPIDPSDKVVVNGIQWDVPDPNLQACKPEPNERDEHVAASPILRWNAPRRFGKSSEGTIRDTKENVRYHLYMDTDPVRLAQANEREGSYLGSTEEMRFATEVRDPLADYFWRIDVEHQGIITRGQIWRFKIRALAFPSAEGYGRFAIGGRGGRVIEVTNLNDAGPGSLREAVEAEGPRTVVFRVGGTIELKSKLIIHNPYITIAGQTAPGDGICVRGHTFGCMGAHDVIMRYMRIRVGDESGKTMDGTGFASTDHSIYDHCSISWSIDEAVSSRSARNITLQRCIVAEALNIANHSKYEAGKGHSFAGSISGDVGSFHHNLLVHCAGRNWSLAGGYDRGGRFAGRLDIRNNVVFNWQNRTNDGGVKALNLVNNLYIPGPASRVFHLLKPDVGSPSDRQQYYVAGNRMEGRYSEEGDNWKEGVVVATNEIEAIRLVSPFCESHVVTHSVEELLPNILEDVGANHRGWDKCDQRVLSDVRQRSTTAKGSRSGLPGIIDSQGDVGGWPELQSGTPPNDSDHDGLPDEWENSRGLSPVEPSNNARFVEFGLTALEIYLAELVGYSRQLGVK